MLKITPHHAGALALMAVIGCAVPAAAQQSPEVTACMNEQDPDGQIRGCTAAIKSGQWKGKDLAWAFINRGVGYAAKGQFDRAIQDHDQAIKLNPGQIDAYLNRGFAYLGKSDFDRAIQSYDQVIKLNPNDALAFNNRGTSYAAKGQYERAIQDYDHSIKLDPSTPLTFWNRANAWYLAGNFDRAFADYEAISGTQSHAAAGLYGRGLVKLRNGDAASGQEDIDAAKGIQADIAEQFAKAGVN